MDAATAALPAIPVFDTGLGNIESLYGELSFAGRLRAIRDGLRPGASERDRKLARRELARFSSAAAAAAIVLLSVALLLLLRPSRALPPAATVPVEILEPDVMDCDPDPPEPPEVVNFDADMPNNDVALPGLEDVAVETDVPLEPASVQPAPETTVPMTRSPIVLRGVRAGPGGMKGGSFGVGDGSALVSDMVGRMIDLKKDGAGNPRNADFRADVKRLLDAGFSAEALAAFHCPTNRLYLNKLVVPAQPAEGRLGAKF